jgi:hypothetical protein
MRWSKRFRGKGRGFFSKSRFGRLIQQLLKMLELQASLHRTKDE